MDGKRFPKMRQPAIPETSTRQRRTVTTFPQPGPTNIPRPASAPNPASASALARQRMDSFRRRMGGIGFGGDYNPEQWDPDTWREDMELMHAAGVNSVTVGVFAWASLEPTPGHFEFEWLDNVLDLLHDNDIAVDLATPTMAPPIWLTHENPQVL